MKKNILSLVALVVLSTNLIADGSVEIGYSSNDVASDETKGGFYMGLDSLKNVRGFLLGAGFNINTFEFANNSAYTMAVDALMGYTLKNSFDIPFSVKGGVGYGVTHFETNADNDYAMQYSASLEYDIYKGWGLGVKYKTTEVEFKNTKIDIDSTMIYLNKSF